MSTFCMSPYKLKDQDLYVPCGHCPNCWSRRISAWSFRLQQELKISRLASFITLTYDDLHVPLHPCGDGSRYQMVLCKRDVQLFFKRFRKYHARDCVIKYFAVGEYGGKGGRPHYHVLCFNGDVELIERAWCADDCNGDYSLIGEFKVGSVTPASIGYTLKYMCKPPKKIYDTRPSQFSLMSKGLGGNYLSDSIIDWHKSNLLERMYCPGEDGKKICMPRYYKDLLYTQEEKEAISAIQVQNGRESNFKAFLDAFKVHGDDLYSHRTKSLVVAYNNCFKNNKRKDL